MQQLSLNFVFINGRGASGKDTHADLLVAQNPHAVRISTGDIYRGAKTPDGAYGKFYGQIKPHIEHVDNKGGYIPDEVILPIVYQVVEDHIQEGKSTLIFTGFPRTIDQLHAVDKYLLSMRGRYEKVNVHHVCLAVLEEHSKERAEHRLSKAQGNGSPIRRDDKPSVVLERLKTYTELTEPMLKLLAREKRLRIVRSNGTIQETHERMMRALRMPLPDPEVHAGIHKER